MAERMQAYLKTVQEQIRWKRARPVLALELEQHLTDQITALQAEGKDEDTATRLALEDMGDPVEIGAELDRIHRPRPQWGLLGLTAVMACGGAFLRLFLTAGWMDYSESTLFRTILALALGTVCLFGAYFLDISQLARYAGRIYLAVLIIGYGCFLGKMAFAWISPDSRFYIHGLPYYLVLLFPIVYAFLVYACRNKGWRGLVLAWVGVFPLAILGMYWSVSVANGVVLMCTGSAVVLYAAWKGWFGVRRWLGFGAALSVDGVLTALLIWWILHRTSRFTYVIHPEWDPDNQGWFGLRVREFLQDIPLVRTAGTGIKTTSYPSFVIGMDEELGRDFYPAIIAARWGWLAFLALLAVTAALIGWLLVRGLRQTHRLGCLVAISAALSLGFRAVLSMILNMGYVLFSTGFPFLGGNAFMIMDMALAGLVLSAFRGDSIAREAVSPPLRRIRKIRLLVEYR